MATNIPGPGGGASSKVSAAVGAVLAEKPWSSPLRERVSRLIQAGHPLEVEVALLRASCDHPEPACRAHASRLLARFPTVKRPAKLPARADAATLAQALAADDVLARREAGERASRLVPGEARKLALAAIRRPEPEGWLLTAWVRLLVSLTEVEPEPEDADEFASLLDHRSPAVQAAALEGLGKVSPEAGPVAAQRKRRVGDPRLRAAALGILAQVSPDQLLPALLETASHDGWWMRGAVYPLLQGLPPKDAEAVTIAALGNEEDHANLVSGLVLLARVGSEACAATVRQLLNHDDARVAQVAKNTWKRLSDSYGAPALSAASSQDHPTAPEPASPASPSSPPPPTCDPLATAPPPATPATPAADTFAQEALRRLASGDLEDAVADLQEALDEGKAALTPVARFALATACLWADDRVAAMTHLRGLDPTALAPPHLYCLARDLEAAGLPAEARRLHQQVEARLPGYLDAAGRVVRLPVEDGGLPAAAWDALATRYDDLRPLGQGGMGSVYRARDRIRGRDVALKIPREDILDQPRVRERFLLEMEALAGLDHPNVVPILEVAGGDLPHFSMEFVEGRTLGQVLAEEGPLPPERAQEILRALAAGLGHVHAHQVVHRDLKPDNILLDEAGTPRISDFGLAANALRMDQEELGKAVGTLTYMAPEQLLGGEPEPPADVYSLGAIVYEALTGGPPFRPSQAIEKLREPAPSLYEALPDGPGPLIELVDRCLLKDAEDRFQDGQALLEALDALDPA